MLIQSNFILSLLGQPCEVYTEPMKKFSWLVPIFGFASLMLPALASGNIPNHSFEDLDNEDAWVCDSNCTNGDAIAYFVFTSDLERQPPDGIWYLYIFHEAGLYEDVSIPADTRTLTFGYYNTEDDTGDEIYDGIFTLSLIDTVTQEVYVQETFSDQADNWGNGVIEIPAAAQGKTAQLYISNVTGFNRIDDFAFTNRNQNYAAAKVRVLSSKDKAVEDAKVYIKKNGNKVSLFNLKTNEIVKSVTTNSKGRAPHFEILRNLAEGASVQLCAKKNSIEECVKIQPEVGAETSYDFSFESKKITAL